MIKGIWFALALAASAWAANVELKLSQPVAAKLAMATCLHEEPRGDSSEVMCMNAGAPLTLVARMQDRETWNNAEGYWYKAEFGDGGFAWVFSTFVDFGAADKGGASCPSPSSDPKH